MDAQARWSGRTVCLLAAGLLIALTGWRQALAATEYSFAVVPQFEQRKLFAVWRPIVDELSRRSGFPLKLVAPLSVAEFETQLSGGSYDIVYANPYHILRESSRQGYIPLIRDATPLRGIIVVARDSPFRTPADLAGQRLGIPSPNALGASLLVRADLERLFKVKVEPVNVKTHSSVYLHVANGLLPAGGGVEKTLAEQTPAVQALLRVFYTTREMPSHPIAAHPRLPPEVRTALRKALLEMAATPEGLALLEKVPMSKPVAASIKDYAPMLAWDLEKYWTP
ncbi:phosphate/phosphite/phosphonate ABC transporter substrate-binding protein [Azonexus sp. R2A61]|uniref:phosphate/phosphite/phosphonate ABC transporter substrate-binding protein n=1 Tax=Azonexus sp. R2A61 TaxID=2744443 RepID=UPI001F328FE5|nr:phosphate/phosphite/phosphonate ABC transporter substrate-binding protein [Azonexus sp. R2A61]